MKYDIKNPTTARRIIHDGPPHYTRIQVDAGETKSGVELADSIAEQFGDGSDGDISDLIVKPSAQKPPAAKPAAKPKAKATPAEPA